MSSFAPRQWHERALAVEQSGDRAAALSLIEQGLKQHPKDPDLFNSAGSLAQRLGRADLAERHFARAASLAPQRLDFTVNRAIALSALGRDAEAADLLSEHEPKGAGDARYWSVRANAERGARRAVAAAASYERCLACDPRHPRGLHGRARVALERGEPGTRARFDRALAVKPGDPDLWLGKAQALEVEGDVQEALRIADQLVAQMPGWLDGVRYAAQLRTVGGEADSDAPFRAAARALPDDARIAQAHVDFLAAIRRPEQAVEVAAEARQRYTDADRFTLLEAVHAGMAGDNERAHSLFQELAIDTPDRRLHRARHRLRRGMLDAAEDELLDLAGVKSCEHTAYALLGLIWRLTGDERAQWLHEQPNLVRKLPLRRAENVLSPVRERLGELHDASVHPLGQSLRGGTQTRHNLFERHEPIFAELHEAILETLEDYRNDLPPKDSKHPLLRHRVEGWRIAGSWSVRLSGGGDHHAAHIHPQGMVSSALYLVTHDSKTGEEHAGSLEIGRPPPDLGLDLGPLEIIRPEPGFLALFPSTLYHGTVPFEGATRMSVAFDVVPTGGGSA